MVDHICLVSFIFSPGASLCFLWPFILDRFSLTFILYNLGLRPSGHQSRTQPLLKSRIGGWHLPCRCPRQQGHLHLPGCFSWFPSPSPCPMFCVPYFDFRRVSFAIWTHFDNWPWPCSLALLHSYRSPRVTGT